MSVDYKYMVVKALIVSSIAHSTKRVLRHLKVSNTMPPTLAGPLEIWYMNTWRCKICKV